MEAADEPSVWVLDAGDLEIDRSARLARALARRGAATRALGSRWCVALPPSFDAERWRRRVERRLGRPVEERANCDVAWFPLGHGYAAVLVEPPAEDLEGWLDGAGLQYREIRRPSGGEAVVRVCVPLAALASPGGFADDLRGGGFEVRAMYEVGACYR